MQKEKKEIPWTQLSQQPNCSYSNDQQL